MHEKVLVPLDGSEIAEVVFAYAQELAGGLLSLPGGMNMPYTQNNRWHLIRRSLKTTLLVSEGN